MRARAIAALAALFLAAAPPALAENAPGVSASEIKIGQTMPYSGPVTAFGTLGKGELAFFNMINDEGGVNGRKITLISLDDGYAPPKTVEQTRKLVEQEEVAFLFSSIGTATNTAIQKYLNDRKVPQLFIGSGASKWGNPQQYPWTIGGVQGTFRAEGRIYARYILKQKPGARIGVLYQNDDYGKDYFLGLKDVLGDAFDKTVVAQSYEFTDPTIDSQIVSLQGSGVDAIIVGATPKFAAQAIRKVYDIGWKPMFFLSNVAIWVNSVMAPAGMEKGVGIISSAYVKDPTDPGWANDPGMRQWQAFMKKYMPDADANDQNYVNSYNSGMVLVQVLKQCGDDLSRENILKQATNLHDLALPMLLPGIRVSTSPTDYYPVKQMQLMRWDGKHWVRFGEVLSGT
ncbi:MAG TPA: ABC transporter substrate-binding protein [Stellaceae bacterium]|nr:ABC transporter substrate-binding protein [Stellaceae bacterium]